VETWETDGSALHDMSERVSRTGYYSSTLLLKIDIDSLGDIEKAVSSSNNAARVEGFGSAVIRSRLALRPLVGTCKTITYSAVELSDRAHRMGRCRLVGVLAGAK
jgi:hypothetical protein